MEQTTPKPTISLSTAEARSKLLATLTELEEAVLPTIEPAKRRTVSEGVSAAKKVIEILDHD